MTTIYIIHNMTSFFFPEPFTVFHHGMWSCDSVTCDLSLIPNSSSKNRIDWKKKKKRKKKREANKIKSNFCISNIGYAKEH